MNSYRKIELNGSSNVILRVTPGHFVTPNAHVNYYIDMSAVKCRVNEAKAVAAKLAEYHNYYTAVDSIICIDGTEVIGAYLADELMRAGVLSINQHKAIYVLTPETASSGQMVFRENYQTWIRNKNVLLLFSAATTGNSILRAVEAVKYYGATITGISAIFSTVNAVCGIPVYSIFTQKNLPDYCGWNPQECPCCKQGIKVDGLCNGFGITSL